MSDQQQPYYGSYPPPSQPTETPEATFTQPATEPPAPKKKRTGLFVGLGVALLAALGAGGYFAFANGSTGTTSTPAAAAPTTKPTTVLEEAARACALSARPQDLGHTLTLDNVGAKEYPGPDDYDDARCLFNELHIPSYVVDHIGQTRALDGTQTDSWEGMNARWNYHPDNGMNIMGTME